MNNVGFRYSPNFKAELKLADSCSNKTRLRYIGKVFSAKTPEFPCDTLVINGSFKQGFELSTRDDELDKNYIAKIPEILSRKLAETSSDYIADYLKTVLRVLKTEQSLDKSFVRIAEDMGLRDTDGKFYQALKNQVEKEKEYNKDLILSRYRFWPKFLITKTD